MVVRKQCDRDFIGRARVEQEADLSSKNEALRQRDKGLTRREQETKKLEAQRDDIISVSLDTDPNEDASNIRSHIQKNGFDWRYAIASGAVSASLSQDFGADILSVPLAPMIVVCENNKATQIRNGVKSASELSSTIDDLCA